MTAALAGLIIGFAILAAGPRWLPRHLVTPLAIMVPLALVLLFLSVR